MSSFSLRDHLFNANTVGRLASRFHVAVSGFDPVAFMDAVLAPFPDLQLKARIAHISDVMRDHLPDDYPEAIEVIVASLPPPLDPTLGDDDFGEFIYAPLSHYVARFGCTVEHLDLSLAALLEITTRFSAEDAIRSFINAFPHETLQFLLNCSVHPNYHVRRLASEGSRPMLPWSGRLNVGTAWPLEVLDRLHDDPTRYVTRSVANHLNDISKSEPDLVIARLRAWREAGRQAPKEMDFIARHALRSLVKAGHPGALCVLGFGDAPDVDIEDDLNVQTSEVIVGERLEFSFGIRARRPQALLIDYRMHFARPDDRPSSKVYKIKHVKLAKGERVVIRKRHRLRQMSTRTLYPGSHRVEIQINGVIVNSFSFELRDARRSVAPSSPGE